MRNLAFVGFALAACWTASGATDVRRVAMPPRLVRGDTNVRRLGPWDSAAWIWRKDASLPPGGEFIRFRKEFSADGKSPLRFHVSADEPLRHRHTPHVRCAGGGPAGGQRESDERKVSQGSSFTRMFRKRTGIVWPRKPM